MTHISTNRAHPKNVMGPDSTTTPNRTGRPRIKTPRGTPVFSRGGPAGVQVLLICFFLKVNAAPPPGGAALQTSTLLLLGKSLIDPTMVDIWILGRTWCVWFRIGSGVVTGSTAVC